MTGPQTLPDDPLRSVIAATSTHRAAQAARSERFAALATVAQIAGA